MAEIEKQFTRLDAGVTALKRVQANLKRYRAAVLKAACEGRLVPTEAVLARAEGRTYETGAQLLERILRQRRKVSQGTSKESPAPNTLTLSSLPVGWAWGTVAQISESIVDCPHSTAKFISDGEPCVDTTCINQVESSAIICDSSLRLPIRSESQDSFLKQETLSTHAKALWEPQL